MAQNFFLNSITLLRKHILCSFPIFEFSELQTQTPFSWRNSPLKKVLAQLTLSTEACEQGAVAMQLNIS